MKVNVRNNDTHGSLGAILWGADWGFGSQCAPVACAVVVGVTYFPIWPFLDAASGYTAAGVYRHGP